MWNQSFVEATHALRSERRWADDSRAQCLLKVVTTGKEQGRSWTRMVRERLVCVEIAPLSTFSQ